MFSVLRSALMSNDINMNVGRDRQLCFSIVLCVRSSAFNLIEDVLPDYVALENAPDKAVLDGIIISFVILVYKVKSVVAQALEVERNLPFLSRQRSPYSRECHLNWAVYECRPI
jgi:hypothetical protein